MQTRARHRPRRQPGLSKPTQGGGASISAGGQPAAAPPILRRARSTRCDGSALLGAGGASVHARRTVVSEMALTWRLVTGCGGGMADARNVASPAACASSGSRHAPHAGALPSPTLSPTDPVPQGPLTLWARAGPVYAYMYVCVHVHARAHARTHTHHIYNGSATAQKKDGEGAANSTPRVYGRSRATAPRRPTSASVAGKHTMCKHTGRGAGRAGRRSSQRLSQS